MLYPAGVPNSRWLEHYAKSFDTVEINASFYRVPKAETFARWRESVPPGFAFSVKVDRRITHYNKLKGVHGLWRDFAARCENLGDKLGCFLLQFPANFGPDVDRLRKFLELIAPARRCAFEFRHPGWFCEEAYAALKEYGRALCRASSPRWPDEDVATADFVYVRMHGGSSLYSSNYGDAELRSWAKQLRQHLRAGLDAYVYFNNDAHGYAVQNAIMLRKLLSRGGR